ncbi:MAG: M10 family metallopeptidase C-terminal domain-containing protein [Hydrogenophaga sp.]|nr:M10 family metallopeptidase C-terminal domain-containing protein [Hydrogenophaga sp.]MBW8321741.1 M10 family metallopeptidase C-terminal domain-containing protein [Rhizobium sp.]
MTAGQTYTFALVGTGGNGLDDAYLRLRNSAGAEIRYDDDGGPGSNSTITFTAATSGTYYLDVGSFSNASSGQYGLSFTAGSRAHYDYMMGAGNLIRDGASWSATPGRAVTVTYSFDTSNPDQIDAGGISTAFIALSAAQRTAAQQSLSLFSDVGNVTFTQAAANTGTMRFSAYNSTTDGAGAYAYFPGGTGASDLAGDVNLNNDSVSTTSIPRGSYSFFAMLHEIGHAMGLAHPGDYNAGPGVDITYDNSAQFSEDSHQYSVMSYFDESNTTGSFNSYPDTLLLYDILAIQQLYGVNYNTRSGNSVYGFNANTGSVYNFSENADPVFCIWDGGGTDTIDASLYSMAQRIDLNAASFSNIGGFSGNISIAVGAVIENAKGGSGNDGLVGNSVANSLFGNNGNDWLDGRAGADTLNGGAGNDTYILGSENDAVTDSSGTDTITSTITRSLAGYSMIERLTLAGTGNINGTGNGLANILTGNSGNNVLDGGTGVDTLVGGAGNDTYVLGAENDTVSDSSGIDRITSTITRSLGGYSTIENLTLLGTGNINGAGNALANVLIGNAGNNVLDGGAGNDSLSSGNGADRLLGGLGNDTLTGGAGADVFVFNTALNASTNVDTITDFSVADDVIWLENSVFTALGAAGALASTAFVRNTTGLAADASDRLIYESDTGELYYDSNGSAAGGSTLIAVLNPSLLLTHLDFSVI